MTAPKFKAEVGALQVDVEQLAIRLSRIRFRLGVPTKQFIPAFMVLETCSARLLRVAAALHTLKQERLLVVAGESRPLVH